MSPIVSIIMGSTSDLPVMEKAAQLLNDLHVPFEMNALSAHRTPEAVEEFAKNARQRGIKVIIAAAGMAAALACAEQGLKTVAVEKGASPTWRSATMGAFHDRVHQKFGVEFDTKQWMDDAMVNCSYRGEQTIYQKWVDTCDEAVDLSLIHI